MIKFVGEDFVSLTNRIVSRYMNFASKLLGLIILTLFAEAFVNENREM